MEESRKGGREGERERGRAVLRNAGERRLESAASSSVISLCVSLSVSLSYTCTHTTTAASPGHFSCLIEPELPGRIIAQNRTVTLVFVCVHLVFVHSFSCTFKYFMFMN